MKISESKPQGQTQNMYSYAPNVTSLQNNISEMGFGCNFSVPIKVINKAAKSICKIIIKKNPYTFFGTGFFMKVT